MANSATLLMTTSLKAGSILLANGAEIERVEDTMNRINHQAGFPQAQVFVLLTGITISIPEHSAQVQAIHTRGMDLEKVDAVNTLSRRFAANELSLVELQMALQEVDQSVPTFPFWWQLLAALVVSVTLMVAFTGHFEWVNLMTAAIAGMVGFGVFAKIETYLHVRFISEFLGALGIGLITAFGQHLFAQFGYDADAIIIGSLMPLVPGVAITNAVRDTMTGNLVSGPARAVDALLSACAIGLGIALTTIFY